MTAKCRAGVQPMFRLAAAVLISAVLFASSADAACSGTPPGVAYIEWATSGASACPGTAAGQNCTGQCRPGYINLAPVTVRCDGSTWAPPSGRCFKACTQAPPAHLLRHGGVWPESCAKSLTGSTCKASCPVGSAAIKCLDDGTWDVSLDGQCAFTPSEEKELRQGTCGNPAQLPMTIANGGRWPSSCAGTPVGQNCVGACNDGYGNTPPELPCVADPNSATGGSFNTSAATGFCTRICPGLPPAGLLTTGTWPGSCTNSFVNTFCTASCPFGTARILCAPGGVWDVSTLQGGCSNSLVCGTAPSNVPANTMPFPASCLDGTKGPGSTCTYECRPGYGQPPVVTCVQTGPSTAEWQNPTPDRCNRVCAGAPPASLLNGVGSWPASCTDNTLVNSFCEASCPNGAARILCAPGGVWDTSTFTGACSNTLVCSTAPTFNVPNAFPFPSSCLSGSNGVGSTCAYQCRPGYGQPPVVTCVQTGPNTAEWQNPTPDRCNRVCAGSPPASLLNGTGSWPASCTDNTLVNTVCEASCPFGIASVLCGSDGNWVTSSFRGACQNTPACIGPPPLMPDQASWGAACVSSPEGTLCQGTCRQGFNGDDPPIALCVSNGSTVAWTAPFPAKCTSGAAPPPRTVLAEPAANEVIICDDTNTFLPICEINSGVTPYLGPNSPASPAFNSPVGVAAEGSVVAITDSNPSRLRYCITYSRRFISCGPSVPLGDNPSTSNAAAVTLDPASAWSYTALTNEDSVACCNGITCSSKSVDGMVAPRGVDFKFGNVFVAHMGGVTRCPTNGCFDNTTCTTTPLPIDGNGILVTDGRVYLGMTTNMTVMVCDLGPAPTFVISNCVLSPVAGPFNNNGPSYANMIIGASGQIYTPLWTSRSAASVMASCPPGKPLTGCEPRSYTISPPRPFTGISSVAHQVPLSFSLDGRNVKDMLPSADMSVQGWV